MNKNILIFLLLFLLAYLCFSYGGSVCKVLTKWKSTHFGEIDSDNNFYYQSWFCKFNEDYLIILLNSFLVLASILDSISFAET